MRINKFLASCGIASRRKCEELIINHQVKVNDKIITDLSTNIDINDKVFVDNHQVFLNKTKKYIMLNKPTGYITTKSDDRNRPTVMDLINDKTLFPIGRLDFNTSGLLLFSNDGDVANALMHPKFEVKKTYIAKIMGTFFENDARMLEDGVFIDGYKTGKAIVKILKNSKTDLDDSLNKANSDSHPKSLVEISIFEGKNRQVRKMFESLNFTVIKLKRISLGEIELKDLPVGSMRNLTKTEIDYLLSLI